MTTSQWVLENINPSIWEELGETGLRRQVREFLDSKDLRKVLLWGRRTGSTFAFSLRAALALASPPLDVFAPDLGYSEKVFADFFPNKTQRPREILYIAPSKAHVLSFFEMTMKLANAFGTILTRACKGALCRIESPGAHVIAFAAPEGNPLAMCGQSADIVMVDCAAYVSQEVLTDVVHPIVYTRPGIAVIIASTPSLDSKRNEWLKHWCEQSTVLRARINDIPGMNHERVSQTVAGYPADGKLILTELFAEFPEE